MNYSTEMVISDRDQGSSGSKTLPSYMFAANCYPSGSLFAIVETTPTIIYYLSGRDPHMSRQKPNNHVRIYRYVVRYKILSRVLMGKTTACYGFPLALQLLAFEAVLILLTKIPEPDNMTTFLSDPYALAITITLMQMNDVLDVDLDPKGLLFELHYFNFIRLDIFNDEEDSDVGWDDEVADDKVSFLLELKRSGYQFKESDFPSGDTSIPPI
ncbi:unnamed protein product [Thlaspi arvense]|uniref:Uncharacterized protein n=1 Tax=Thlaspi arvense TaxID=13288 RepID=A0AAU9T9G6_THLAR|nr:unnamed protein product [Thlaspi arvense]